MGTPLKSQSSYLEPISHPRADAGRVLAELRVFAEEQCDLAEDVRAEFPADADLAAKDGVGAADVEKDRAEAYVQIHPLFTQIVAPAVELLPKHERPEAVRSADVVKNVIERDVGFRLG